MRLNRKLLSLLERLPLLLIVLALASCGDGGSGGDATAAGSTGAPTAGTGALPGMGGSTASGGGTPPAGGAGSPSAGAGGGSPLGGNPGTGGAVAGSAGAAAAPATGGSAAGGVAGAAGAPNVGGNQSEIPTIDVGGGRLKLELCAPDVVRVAFATDDAFFARQSLITAPKRCEPVSHDLVDDAATRTITTSALRIRVDLGTGAVSFFDLADQPILTEVPTGRTLDPTTVQGESTNSVRQEWQPNSGEALYGLGQHQHGALDIKGYDLDLRQYNTEAAVPFLVSSRGYGVLWDNTSFTRFGDIRPFEPIPANGLADGSGNVNGRDGGSVDYQGSFQAPSAGDYQFRTFSSGTTRLWVDDRLLIDHFRQGWLTMPELAKVTLGAGSHDLRLEWSADPDFPDVNILQAFWKTPTPDATTSLWSEVGDGLDYYFVYGPALDRVIAGYRRLSGEAPMPPRWAFGLWQCRERYQSAEQMLDVLEGFRSRGIPLDAIVQDWQYWGESAWGSHAFDPSRFPDPNAWIQSIHDEYDAKIMISVWPKFDRGTDNFDALDAAGFLYQPNLDEDVVDFLGDVFTFYDAFDADARAMFWSQMNSQLFARGVDAWWMDATEPEIVEGPWESSAEQLETFKTHMHPTALGSGSRVLNAYSLVNSQGVYEGQRAAAPNQRVFILTRSAFAGIQRYASATWSGDITSTWTAFRKQIPAGLGFALSGIPYWTLDIGGFAVPARLKEAGNVEEWRELATRWFEFGTFLPLTRVHGQAPVREMWEFGGEGSPAYLAQLKFDRLRYRLLPYIYSLAGQVTHQAGTILRPLVMDFPNDPASLAIPDQYLFGPALLVSPVTTFEARSRSLYLPPAAGGWYDFWTGAAVAGGQSVTADAPYDAIPVHVRAGSIVPFGPELEFTAQAPADPIVLYVYSGADGAFTLYEDQGETYDYENGAFTRIAFAYQDATRTLSIGAREGSYPEMLATRTFQIVRIDADKAVGFSFSPSADQSVSYDGTAVSVVLE